MKFNAFERRTGELLKQKKDRVDGEPHIGKAASHTKQGLNA